MIIQKSDQDFPRTKYSTPILTPTKKEGNDYAGILLCIIVSLVSRKGRNELISKSHIPAESIDDLIPTLELIIGMEEFSEHGQMNKKDIGSLKMVAHFINKIKLNCQ